MGNYSIRDLEKLSNIKAHTLRIWEQRYNLLEPKRTPTKIRYYDDQDLRKILNVSFLKQNGHKISHIARLSSQEMETIVDKISNENFDSPNQVSTLILAMMDMDEARFEKVITTNSMQIGFESCMVNIVFPFLKRIGVLWQTGSINPAHEHFISNLIRQKIIVALDGQISSSPKPKHFALFLPEGELHELSLLFAGYIVKSRGQKMTYLGQSLPMEDLAAIKDVVQPDYLFSVFTNHPSRDKLDEYIRNLCEYFPNATILLTGHQVLSQEVEFPPRVEIIDSFKEFIEFVEKE